MAFFLQLVLNGVMVGMLYALVAFGFVMIYKSSKVFNFAQGQMAAIGGYVMWGLLAWTGMPLPLALASGLGISIGLATIVSRSTIHPLIGQPILSIIMMTVALGALMDGMVMAIWGGVSKSFSPPIFPAEPLQIGGLIVNQQLVWSFGVALLIFGAFTLFFQRTKIGLCMRAVAEGHQAARSTGISVKRILDWSWVIAFLTAMVGGFLLGNINGLGFELSTIGLKAFPVVLLGGLESIPGCIIGGLIVGIAENLGGGYLDTYVGGGMVDVVPFVLIIIILFVKPFGLFGEERIERI